MRRGWPKSKLAQVGIAFLIGAISSAFAFNSVETSRFKLYARVYPQDGQDGLGAFMDALQAGFCTLLGVFALVFVRQRLLSPQKLAESELAAKPRKNELPSCQ